MDDHFEKADTATDLRGSGVRADAYQDLAKIFNLGAPHGQGLLTELERHGWNVQEYKDYAGVDIVPIFVSPGDATGPEADIINKLPDDGEFVVLKVRPGGQTLERRRAAMEAIDRFYREHPDRERAVPPVHWLDTYLPPAEKRKIIVVAQWANRDLLEQMQKIDIYDNRERRYVYAAQYIQGIQDVLEAGWLPLDGAEAH
ncbi:hypothetical protein A2Z00_03725 [Candidatus Gottesmanbacteria bacterium RBG_13_45_10]|uniref:Uncharacterized protein n=1 Tax=Candidatus Gottesmanbacteria bacterium RBG_13_45_10 TaxID=1798370 RepID=A0A1F5ZF11_9BACT|nr:MAG: hypothetical protein A2Z00_03725 [Candidatus Gottesmanbacteria bacterium RBG_13_45_10]